MISYLDLIDRTVIYGNILAKRLDILELIHELEEKYGKEFAISPEFLKNLSDLEHNKVMSVKKLLDDVSKYEVGFNLQYRQSLKRLLANNGLPVHINAFDIHDHNIDIDNMPRIADKFEKGNGFQVLDLFEDKTLPAFSNAPYNFCFVQLESYETFKSGIGSLVKKSNSNNTSAIERLEKVADKEMVYDFLELEKQETCMLVQHYSLDEYVPYLHLFSEGKIGLKINDTLRGALLNSDGGDAKWHENKDNLKFIQIYDIITFKEDNTFCEAQIITWLDETGTPVLSKQTKWLDTDTASISDNAMYYIFSNAKVFQWWNSDNDLLEQADIKPSNSWQKKIKKQFKGNNKPVIKYKTLTVNSKIKVIDGFGVERSPLLREIAQHTRRGHWAHYGINGKGKFFGKYIKSVYRKPKTIGKLDNGLIIKDYTLEEKQ